MAKYPKHGADCQYTEDCIWGTDGLCDRPRNRKCVLSEMEENKKKEKDKENG